MSEQYDYYPDINPYAVDYIKVSESHTLAYEQVGNPHGIPALFLHGGPGVGIFPEHRRLFDPKRYRAILLDQRGAGRSTPFAGLEENTTWDIVEDLELLRRHLGISEWVVTGGSWGSTLALCYAIRYPQSVSRLVLRGVFLARPTDIAWVYRGESASAIFPEAWDEFVSRLPVGDQSDPRGAYYRALTSDSLEERSAAATAWTRWEASIMSPVPDRQEIEELTTGDRSISLARTECHYAINDFFMPTGNYIIENADRIKHISCHIIHGRYDIVCPVKGAWDLHKVLPDSTITIAPMGGHTLADKGMKTAMISALNAPVIFM